MIVVRGFEEHDAAQVSALFNRVYGEDYFYPQIYLPSVICHHNRTRHWQSVVALQGGRLSVMPCCGAHRRMTVVPSWP